MRRLCVSIALATVAILLIAVPALAAYYAYIQVEETGGNSYDNLPLICSTNVSQLAQYGFITSTGLTSRVLTGSGYALPHMLANDKILFVTDLDAYEEKNLIFYPKGATSLSSFPIIVGYDGYITTPDDPDLELTYVMQALYSGRFDSSAGEGKYVHYKEDAWKVWISDDDEISVAGLSAGDVEEWTMSYDSFTSGLHTVYVVSNGLGAYLYVDDFDVAKDTHNLYESNNAIVHTGSGDYVSWFRRTFYAQSKYWVFYDKNDDKVYYKTSADGLSWSSEYSIATGDTSLSWATVTLRDGYLHLAYADDVSDTIKYRRGEPQADSSIVWSDAWQTAVSISGGNAARVAVAADTDNYPMLIYQRFTAVNNADTYISKSSTNDGTWSTAGGYPLTLVTGVSYGLNCAITDYPDSDKMYALYRNSSQLLGRYYNGTSWAGSSETIYTGGSPDEANCVADDDDNVYIVWHDYDDDIVYLRIRYTDGSFSSITEIADNTPGYSGISVSYNPETDYIYITYIRNNYARCVTYNQNELTGEYTLFTSTNLYQMSATAYGSHIGMIYLEYDLGQTGHGYLQFPWDWDDNGNDWTWMQNNVMPYADDLLIAIDGTIQLEYEPATIIQGTTLPDEQSDHDGIITWGSNPSGVDASISSLQSDEQEGVYYYPYDGSDSQDIIEPEPAEMTTDVDLTRLEDNPLSPLVHLITDASGGQLTLRLVWLGLAWLILIVAMLLVHLGPDTHKDSVKPQHFVLTSLTGLGLSILFYSMGIFPLWVPILLVFGLIASIVYERMPVL